METSVDLALLARLHSEHVTWVAAGYARALPGSGFDGVVIHSGTPMKRSAFDDQYWPQRPTPHFQHWLPLVVPHSALVIEPGRKPLLALLTARDFWESPAKPESDHFWAAFDVREVRSVEAVKSVLPAGRRLAFVGEDRTDATAWGFPDGAILPAELMRRLDALRVVKSEYERTCLREANRRAAAGHAAVLAAFRDGDHSELDLHLLYLKATAQDDPETPYKNIVALGEHAATLHHVTYARALTGAQSLLLDAGARFQGYDSDITRTAVKGRGAAAQVFGELIARMEALQTGMCREVRSGVPYEQLHNRSHEMLAPILRDLGIARGSDAELVGRGITRKFLPHGLGHSLGLQTHDVGCRNTEPEVRNPFLRNTTPVAPGQVFTIEPGCYFIDSLLDELRASPEGACVDWNLVAALRPFGGVRIEDDVAVTAAGVENLTREHLAV